MPTALEVQALVSDLTSKGVGEQLNSPHALDPFTAKRVSAFQHDRGLPMTGLVDALTWERLAEASWTLGARLLFIATPFLRGDDVANLQVRLARLGFNPGRLDGIFGPKSESALREFQANTGLEVTGVLTKLAFDEILRLSSADDRTPVNAIQDLGAGGISGELFIGGSGPFAEALSGGLSLPLHGDDSNLSKAAISSGAGLVLAIKTLAGIDGLHIHFWQGYLSRSLAGEELGSLLVGALRKAAPGIDVDLTGMSLPVLRETPMTALVIEQGNLSEQEVHLAVTVFQEVLQQVIHR